MSALRPFRTHPVAARLILLVAIPLLALASWIWLELRGSLPPEAVTRITSGVSSPVDIERDAQGAVHIRAKTDSDAFFAVGYAQAQDRLWQLEVQRRMARGELSEVFGKDSIDADVWLRTLGLHASARSAWTTLSAPARASLTAYTAGINARIAETDKLPVEFRLLGLKPQPWTEMDSLAWVKVFALDLGGNYRREMDYYLTRSLLGEDRAATFFPGYRSATQATVPAATPSADTGLQAMADTHRRVLASLHLALPNTGSNAWVIGGKHTTDGGALLANDPHLGLQIPSLWYAVSLETPTLHSSGMSLVGLPLVVFGRNDHIAWGGTNMMADTQDLFFERTDANGDRYDTDGGWIPFEQRTETIRVRAEFPDVLRRQYAPVTLHVRSTRHGPIISDQFAVFDRPVALRWTGLDPDDSSYEAFFRLNYAKDWTQFRSALDHLVAPAMNMLYADRAGNIGYIGAGRIPLRRQGEGTLPVPGWDPAYGWKGSVPSAEWPQRYNPPEGYLISANDGINDADYPYFVSHDWASPARARRIRQLIQAGIGAGKTFDVADMERMQADTLDLNVAAMMATLRNRLPPDGHSSRAAQYLAHWDGNTQADSQAASIFHAWMRQLRQQLYSNPLQGDWNNPQRTRQLRRLAGTVRLEQLEQSLRNDDGHWCSAAKTANSALPACDAVLATSLTAALNELHKLRGDWSMDSWGWGQLHRTVYAHPPMSHIKPLRPLFERRIDNGGSADAINVASADFSDAEGYLQKFGAGFRQVIAMSRNRIRHEYMNSTGQSGNVMSRHYDDMVEPFQKVRYYPLSPAATGTDSATSARGTRP